MARTPVTSDSSNTKALERTRKAAAQAAEKAAREAARLAKRAASDAQKAERKRLRDAKVDDRAAKAAARVEAAGIAQAWQAINTVGDFREIEPFGAQPRPGLELVNVEPKRVWATNGRMLMQLDAVLPESFLGRWRKVEVQGVKRMVSTWEKVPATHPDSPNVDKLADRSAMREWAEVDGGVLLTLSKILEPMPESFFTFVPGSAPTLTLKRSGSSFAQPVTLTGEKNWAKNVGTKFSINATYLALAVVALASKEKVAYTKSWRPVVGLVHIFGTDAMAPFRVESAKGHALIMPIK